MEYKDYHYLNRVYHVYKDGKVVSDKGNVLSWHYDKDGYAVVTIGVKNHRTQRQVHRMVAELFVPNPNGYTEVNHIDYNRKNPSADNLEWCTRKQNVNYSKKNYNKKGELNGRSRLTESNVKEIRALIKSGKRTSEIANMFNCGWSTIYNIKTGKTWNQ